MLSASTALQEGAFDGARFDLIGKLQRLANLRTPSVRKCNPELMGFQKPSLDNAHLYLGTRAHPSTRVHRRARMTTDFANEPDREMSADAHLLFTSLATGMVT